MRIRDAVPGMGSGDPAFDVEAVFDPEEYLHFYADRVGPERSDADAEQIERMLDRDEGDRLLDVPCGHGRIANRLAARGYDVVGVDVTSGFLHRAREGASERVPDAGDRAAYVRGDMRDLPFPDDAFDAAYNVFTSFGYFGETGNRRTAAELARVLRPGGRLVVDTLDRDAVVREFSESTVVEREGDYLVDRHEFDPEAGRLRTRRTTFRDGERRESTFSVRTYTYGELARLLDRVDCEVVAAYDGLSDEPYGFDADRLCIVAEYRPA